MSGRRPLAAFYAPMKAPNHPVPSGDRTVARLYVAALQKAGFDIVFPSALRVHDRVGDPDQQVLLRLTGDENAHSLIEFWRRPGARRPDLWFTYHVYHKSPDLVGATVCRWLGIPYAIAEPSHAPKRRIGPWAGFFARAEAAIRQADRVFVATAADAECVAPLRVEGGMVRLPPFIDVGGWPEHVPERGVASPVRLVTVAMMRPGDKEQSYRLLAEALALLPQWRWRLTIVGDGPARPAIDAMFSPFGDAVRLVGQVSDRRDLVRHLTSSDIFVWPAINEAYGMAPLEAALMGLPVVLGDEGGVRDVVRPGETGLLTPPRQADAFALAISRLMDAPAEVLRLGAAAHRFVREERSLDHAAAVLHASLFPLLGRDAA